MALDETELVHLTLVSSKTPLFTKITLKGKKIKKSKLKDEENKKGEDSNYMFKIGEQKNK